jgi:hypothetical protein
MGSGLRPWDYKPPLMNKYMFIGRLLEKETLNDPC